MDELVCSCIEYGKMGRIDLIQKSRMTFENEIIESIRINTVFKSIEREILIRDLALKTHKKTVGQRRRRDPHKKSLKFWRNLTISGKTFSNQCISWS